MRRELVVLTLLLCSCDRIADHAFGLERQHLSLRGDILLTPEGLTLSDPQMRLLGQDSSICAQLLETNQIDRRSNDFDRAMKALKESTLSGQMQLTDGTVVQFISVGREWTEFGTGVDPNDLSICLLPEHRWTFSPGQSVRSVSVKASPALQLRGLYWVSSNSTEALR